MNDTFVFFLIMIFLLQYKTHAKKYVGKKCTACSLHMEPNQLVEHDHEPQSYPWAPCQLLPAPPPKGNHYSIFCHKQLIFSAF